MKTRTVKIRKWIFGAVALLMLLPAAIQAQDAKPSSVEYRKTTLADQYFQSMPNGIIVGKVGPYKGKLITASVITNSVRVIDPDTGKILKAWTGEENGMLGVDDIFQAPDGTIYHVNADGPGIGAIRPDGTIDVLAKGDYEGFWGNSVAVSHDNKTLFFGQAIGLDATYTLDLSDPKAKIVHHQKNVGWPNSADYSGVDGMFYGGNNVYGGVYQFNPKNGEYKIAFGGDFMEFVSSAEVNDATGLIYATEFHLGQTSEIDLKKGTRRIIAKTEPFLDNVAVEDKPDPRIFLCSYAYDTIYEVYRNGDMPRIVSQGDGAIPEGIVVLKDEKGNERMLIRDRFRLREYFPATGKYKALAHATFESNIDDRPGAYDRDRITWRNSVKDFINLRWMRSLHPAGDGKVIMAGNIVDQYGGRFMVFDLKENKPIRVEKGFKATTADAILVGKDVYVANGDVITRVDPDNRRKDVYTGKSPRNFAQSAAGAWVSDSDAGTVLQVAEGDKWLDTPEEIASGLKTPQGMALANDGGLFVIEAKSGADGSGRLLKIDLKSGEKTIIADGLGIYFGVKLMKPSAQVAQTSDGSIYITEPGATSFSVLRPRN